MLRRIAGGIILVGLATAITAAIRLPSHGVPTLDQLVAHEWGTFTTVAGEDGRAIEWLPLNGPTDLPCFVEHFQNSNTVKILPTEDARLIDYETARSRLWGKVRMETPVLYFYGGAPKSALRVHVRFPRGLITEWYPHATMPFQLGVTATALRHPQFASELDWSGVTLAAATTAFPTEPRQKPLLRGARNRCTTAARWLAERKVPVLSRCRELRRAAVGTRGGRRGRRTAEPRFRKHSERRPVRAARIVGWVSHRRTVARHDDACVTVAHGDSRVTSRRPRENAHRRRAVPTRSIRNARNVARLVVRGRDARLLHRPAHISRRHSSADDHAGADRHQTGLRRTDGARDSGGAADGRGGDHGTRTPPCSSDTPVSSAPSPIASSRSIPERLTPFDRRRPQRMRRM